MRLQLTTTAFILLSTSFGAVALTAEDCDLPFGGHGSSGVPFVLSDGFVASEAGLFEGEGADDPSSYYSFLDIVDCRSGETAQMIYSEIAFPNFEAKSEDGKVVISRQKYPQFKAQALSESTHSDLAGVAEIAEQFGYRLALSVVHQGQASETCGCRVFFPSLRGDKELYEVTQ
jgi:hypothetical protein